MPRLHTISANGTTFPARTGEIILDSALLHGVEFPHDCRAGRCGSCIAKVISGVALGGRAFQPRMIYACQARALCDLELQFDRLPPVQSTTAEVASLVTRAADVVEVGISLSDPIHSKPGQYCKFRFRGFPERSFSPTFPADGSPPQHDLTLHVKQVRGGRVSNALGDTIKVGHPVRITGPFGSAFFRSAPGKRLVLVSGGTGFAPTLTIAKAALAEDFRRDVAMVVGARNVRSFYMAGVLVKLREYPNVRLTVTASDISDTELESFGGFVRKGGPADHVPRLTSEDVVYAAGAPAMIACLARMAEDAGADLYSDPFQEITPSKTREWIGRRLRVSVREPAMVE